MIGVLDWSSKSVNSYLLAQAYQFVVANKQRLGPYNNKAEDELI